MLGYMWWAIRHVVPHAIHKDNCVQVDSCCILFEYSLMHTHGTSIGTRVLKRNVMGIGTGRPQGPGPPKKFYKLMKRII